MKPPVSLLLLLAAALPLRAERINQEGRILGPDPVVARVLLSSFRWAAAPVTLISVSTT